MDSALSRTTIFSGVTISSWKVSVIGRSSLVAGRKLKFPAFLLDLFQNFKPLRSLANDEPPTTNDGFTLPLSISLRLRALRLLFLSYKTPFRESRRACLPR